MAAWQFGEWRLQGTSQSGRRRRRWPPQGLALQTRVAALEVLEDRQVLSVNLLHSFTQDGSVPQAGLTLGGSTLYGTTGDPGTLFSIKSDGSSYTVLHSFAGSDGFEPLASLTLVGSTLYGTSEYGGSTYGDGTVFSINTDGSAYTVLHSFAGGARDGSDSRAGLTLVGSTLYGTTYTGGSAGDGTVFSVNTDGSGYNVLHSFTGGPDDGINPEAGLTQVGSALYGTTYSGGIGAPRHGVFDQHRRLGLQRPAFLQLRHGR